MKNFKKLIAVILAVLMVAAIPMTAFAAPHTGTPIGSQYEQDAFVMEAIYLSDEYYSGEEPLWNYDENTYRYKDENGTEWRWTTESNNETGINWIISKDDDSWMYRICEDGTLHIAQTPRSIDEAEANPLELNLVIPSMLDGKTVTSVSSAGDNTTLSIVIPDTVTAIGYSAFRNRSELKRVVIPTSIKSIDVGAFDLTDNIELYYTGTEEQWNEIVVWNHTSTLDPTNHWAVTNFNWLEMPYESGILSKSAIKAVHFNVNPDELEPLVEEEEPVEPTLFEKLVSGITGIIATITGFFKGIFDFFGSVFLIQHNLI